MASADMDDLIFGEICRCCMASKPRMKPLFDTNLFTMLNAVTGLNAHQNDGLPSQLCVPCVLQIRRSHFFKLQCESTDLTLRRYVVESKHLGLYDYDMPSRSTDKAKVKKEADSSLQNDPTGNDEDGESTKTLAQVKFHCPECSKEFTAERKLKRHMRIHFMDKPHFCTECDMSFVEKSNLTKHMRKHTGELRNSKAKPHLCCECGKSFKYSTSLSRHKRFHARRNLFTCTICSKSYVEQNSLDVHMRSHTNERPFGCSICDKHFAQKANLERHERIHTGEKPYRCDLCGKCFSQKSYLCIHKRIHSKEKPFECQDCHKCFISRNSLQKHQRKPCSAHPHRCNVCTKTFRFKKALRLHRQTHRLERPHACKMCEKRFMHATNLATHVKEKHPDGPVGSGDDEYQSEDQKPIVKENDGAPAKSDPLGQRTRKGQAKSLEDSSQEEYGFEDEEDEEEDVDEEEDEEEGEEEEEEDDEEDEEIEIDEDDGMCIIGVDAENMDMEDQSSDEEVVHVMYNGYTEQDEFTTIKQEPLLEIQIMNPGETNSDIEQ